MSSLGAAGSSTPPRQPPGTLYIQHSSAPRRLPPGSFLNRLLHSCCHRRGQPRYFFFPSAAPSTRAHFHTYRTTTQFVKLPLRASRTGEPRVCQVTPLRPPLHLKTSSAMLLRCRGPDGTFRVTVEPTTTFGQLIKDVRTNRAQGSPNKQANNSPFSAAAPAPVDRRPKDNNSSQLAEQGNRQTDTGRFSCQDWRRWTKVLPPSPLEYSGLITDLSFLGMVTSSSSTTSTATLRMEPPTASPPRQLRASTGTPSCPPKMVQSIPRASAYLGRGK